jgi:uncharacterized protein (TIGR02996 family)
MTEEEDFRRQLDLRPDDHHTRLVYADWLDDRGDPRGPGYRALGVLAKVPRLTVGGEWAYANWDVPDRHDALPPDWFKGLRRGLYNSDGRVRSYVRRYNAEDDAALAFARLPAERQRELLSRATS